jgi:putative flippase GtrA
MDVLRPLRFAGVGGAATIAHWIGLLVFWQLDNSPLAASIIAYLMGFAVSYWAIAI